MATASTNSIGFGDRDLHVIDVLAVPDRLEDTVGQSKRQDVLDGLFAEVIAKALRQHGI
jgi:hypothetical protein